MTDQVFITPQQAPQAEREEGVFQRVMAGTDSLQLREVFIERGTVAAPHQHDNDQVTYVVFGQIEMTIGDETRVCVGGDSFAVSKGVVHGVKALADSLMVVTTVPV